GLQRRQVRVVHRHQPPLDHPGAPPFTVDGVEGPGEHAAPHVQLGAGRGGRVGAGAPAAVAAAEGQREPVGRVDQVLVLHPVAVHGGDRAVVAAGDVGAGVVHPVGPGLRGGAAGGEEAVAQGAQGLAGPGVLAARPLVHQPPAAHRYAPVISRSPGSATTVCAPRRYSSASWPPRSTPTTSPNPPRAAASTPASESSSTAVRSGGAPSRRAASRNTAGSGLPGSPSRPASTPSTRASNSPSTPAARSTAAQLRLAETAAVATPARRSRRISAAVEGNADAPYLRSCSRNRRSLLSPSEAGVASPGRGGSSGREMPREVRKARTPSSRA